jgi:hypothetical protein
MPSILRAKTRAKLFLIVSSVSTPSGKSSYIGDGALLAQLAFGVVPEGDRDSHGLTEASLKVSSSGWLSRHSIPSGLSPTSSQARRIRASPGNLEISPVESNWWPQTALSCSAEVKLRRLYDTQFDRTVSSFSGSTGSLVRKWTRNSCSPPMPSCIWNLRITDSSPPGWIVVELTTARGGQQPRMSSTSGSPRICSGSSPMLLTWKTVRIEVSNFTSP